MTTMGIRRALVPWVELPWVEFPLAKSWTSPSARGPLSTAGLRPYCGNGSCATSHGLASPIVAAKMAAKMTPKMTADIPLRYNLRCNCNNDRRGENSMEVNDKSPDFSTTDENGKEVASKDFRGKTE